ncbi:rpt-1, partial [Symbiodinium sp. KB8]
MAEEEDKKEVKALDAGDIEVLKHYGQGPYSKAIKTLENEVVTLQKKVNELV